MSHKVALGLAVCGFVFLALAPTAWAECCSPDFYTKKCADGTYPISFFCGASGGGGCNVFGCNCGGGCRGKKRMERGGAETGWDVVRAADTDGNGALDGVEIALYFRRQGRKMEGSDWRALDSNQDGQLTAHEVDKDLDLATA